LPLVFGEQVSVHADGATGGPEYCDGVAAVNAVFVLYAIVRADGEIGAPGGPNFLAAAHGIAERVDEDVITRHHLRQPFGIVD
jgi:hypothetical protein